MNRSRTCVKNTFHQKNEREKEKFESKFKIVVKVVVVVVVAVVVVVVVVAMKIILAITRDGIVSECLISISLLLLIDWFINSVGYIFF